MKKFKAFVESIEHDHIMQLLADKHDANVTAITPNKMGKKPGSKVTHVEVSNIHDVAHQKAMEKTLHAAGYTNHEVVHPIKPSQEIGSAPLTPSTGKFGEKVMRD